MKFANEDWLWTPARTERLWRNGIGLGAGTALLGILYDQVRTQRRKQQAMDGNMGDTLTLTLPPPVQKVATVPELMGGLAAAGGTYYLLSQLYAKLREKQLKSEIAEADSGYTKNLQQSVDKQGSVGEVLANLPGDLLWMSALASGVGTYGLLNHTWPEVGSKDRPGKPKKIVVKGYGTVVADGPGNGPLAEVDKAKGHEVAENVLEQEPLVAEERPMVPLRKAAAVECPFGRDDERNAAAFLTLSLSRFPSLKMASSALIAVIGSHHANPEAVETLVKQAGFEAAVEASKGGWDVYESLPELGKRAAIWRAYGSPLLSGPLALLALSELNEVSPDMCKRAQVVAADPGYSTVLTKIASIEWQVDTMSRPDLDKSASFGDFQEDMRRQMGTLDISESVDTGGAEDTADGAYQSSKDPIDIFMAGGEVANAQAANAPSKD